jgi:hypothetical protein
VAVKGAVLLFHGFTACPNLLNTVATHLAAKGFHVNIFLTVGHWRQLGACTGSGVDCVSNTPVDELPTTPDGYEAFAKNSTHSFNLKVTRRGLTRATHSLGVAGSRSAARWRPTRWCRPRHAVQHRTHGEPLDGHHGAAGGRPSRGASAPPCR